jgi:hypothetical protein
VVHRVPFCRGGRSRQSVENGERRGNAGHRAPRPGRRRWSWLPDVRPARQQVGGTGLPGDLDRVAGPRNGRSASVPTLVTTSVPSASRRESRADAPWNTRSSTVPLTRGRRTGRPGRSPTVGTAAVRAFGSITDTGEPSREPRSGRRAAPATDGPARVAGLEARSTRRRRARSEPGEQVGGADEAGDEQRRRSVVDVLGGADLLDDDPRSSRRSGRSS